MTHPVKSSVRVLPMAAGVLALAVTGIVSARVDAIAATKPTTSKPTTTVATKSKGGVDPNAPEVNAAGDIPDDIAFVPYTPPSGGYSISTPEGWSRKAIPSGAIFTDKYNIIQAESFSGQTAPTPASASVAVKSALGKSKGFVFGKASTVKRKGGSAVLVTFLVASAPNEVTGKTIAVAVERYEFHRNGTSVVLTLSGAKGADNVDPWKIVTDSFAWLK